MDTYRTKVAADDAEAEKDLDTAVEATYRIRSQYGVAGDWQVLYLEN